MSLIFLYFHVSTYSLFSFLLCCTPRPLFKALYLWVFHSDLPEHWFFKGRKYVSRLCLLRCCKLRALPISKQEIWKVHCGFSIPSSNFYIVHVHIPLFILKILPYGIVRSILQTSDTINGPAHFVEIKNLSKQLDFLIFIANMEDIYKTLNGSEINFQKTLSPSVFIMLLFSIK